MLRDHDFFATFDDDAIDEDSDHIRVDDGAYSRQMINGLNYTNVCGHSIERTTGEEGMEAVYGCAHISHQIKKVPTDTSYTHLYRITTTIPSNVNINPPPLVDMSITTIWTICAGGNTYDMSIGGDNIPQYILFIR